MKKFLLSLFCLMLSLALFAQELKPATLTISNCSKYSETIRIVEFFENSTSCYDITVKPNETFVYKIPEVKKDEWIRVQYSSYFDDKGFLCTKTININFIRIIQFTDNGFQIE